MARKRRALSEDEAFELTLRKFHPEWRRDLDNGTLPEEIIGADGEPMSPMLHLTIHAIVERQLSLDEPKGVVAIAEELSRLGVSRHDIRHEIGRAVANQIWYLQKERCVFDEVRYRADLEAIVASHRRGTSVF